MRIGRQPQDISLLPSTAGSLTWVIGSDSGCPDGVPVPQTAGTPKCFDSRGRLYNSNQSATYVPNSIYTLGVEGNLGLDSAGNFGYDDITLGLPGSPGPSAQHQIISSIADPRYWLGGIGLNPQPSNFTNFVSPQPSMMQTLRQTNQIPSLSYGYTAGAYYKFNHVLGSLTLGGYDSTLFTPNNVSIPLASDATRDIVANVREIRSNASSTTLLPDGNIFAYVDSTISWFYLPITACQAFEKAFGLTWNPTWEFYLINETQHQSLLQKNPTVTFTLGAQQSGGETVDIVLPYAAFDYNISFPFINITSPPYTNTARYFPLKQAANDTQYTLGRTLLQEAYLITDYEHHNFSLSQRIWNQNPPAAQHQTIYPQDYQPTESASSGSSLSGGAIAGIVVGAVAGLVIIAALAFFVRRYQQMKKRAVAAAEAKKDEDKPIEDWSSVDRKSGLIPPPRHPSRIMGEVDSSERYEMPTPGKIGVALGDKANDSSEVVGSEAARELHAEGTSGGTWEADSSARFELMGSEAPLVMSEKLSGARLSGRGTESEQRRSDGNQNAGHD